MCAVSQSLLFTLSCLLCTFWWTTFNVVRKLPRNRTRNVRASMNTWNINSGRLRQKQKKHKLRPSEVWKKNSQFIPSTWNLVHMSTMTRLDGHVHPKKKHERVSRTHGPKIEKEVSHFGLKLGKLARHSSLSHRHNIGSIIRRRMKKISRTRPKNETKSAILVWSSHFGKKNSASLSFWQTRHREWSQMSANRKRA